MVLAIEHDVGAEEAVVARKTLAQVKALLVLEVAVLAVRAQALGELAAVLAVPVKVAEAQRAREMAQQAVQLHHVQRLPPLDEPAPRVDVAHQQPGLQPELLLEPVDVLCVAPQELLLVLEHADEPVRFCRTGRLAEQIQLLHEAEKKRHRHLVPEYADIKQILALHHLGGELGLDHIV